MTNIHNGSQRWLAVGHSTDADAYAAGTDAAAAALEGHDDAKLLILFCSDSYDLPQLLAGACDRSGDVPLIGCSTAGQIGPNGPTDASVVIAALGGDGFEAYTAAAPDAAAGLREAGAKVAACAGQLNGKPHKVTMLLSDALAGDQQEVIRGAYGVLGAAMPIVGACAGDDFKMQSTFQLHGREVLDGGVVAAAIASDGPFGIGVQHGWTKVGDEPVVVTESGGNKVLTLDDQPALDVYLDRTGAPEEARNDADAFAAWGITHPLGLDRRSGEESVRFVAGADFEERSLSMIAEVPQGGVAWFMQGDADSVQSATDGAASAALEALGGAAPVGLFAFDCAARRGVLGDDGIPGEVERLAKHAAGAPLAGFYSYGEIVRDSGLAGFHNQTLVVLAVA